MEKIDYKTQEIKLKQFESTIFSIENFGSQIKEDYIIRFSGPWYALRPVFGFDTLEHVPRGVRETCYQLFFTYFPTSTISSL